MDMKRVATICLLIFFAFLLTSARIKDIAKIEGQTVVQAIGYGLVSGLNNTGDNQLSTHTVQSVINMLKTLWVDCSSNKSPYSQCRCGYGHSHNTNL